MRLSEKIVFMVCTVVSMVTMNLSLLFNSVGFYQARYSKFLFSSIG